MGTQVAVPAAFSDPRHCGAKKRSIVPVEISKRAVVAASLVAFVSAVVWAGNVSSQTLPPGTDPGRVPQRLEPPRTPTIEPGIRAPTVQPALPPDQARRVRFTLRGVVLNGVTAYSPAELATYYQSLVGREISAYDAYEIANRITARYRSDGYVLSQAFIPQQQMRDGILNIQVVEGYINRVIIRDSQGKVYSYTYMLQYAERLKAARPVHQSEIERYLLLLNDFPGMRVSGVLAPSDLPGTADLIVEPTYKRVDLYTTWDNRGSRFIGPIQSEFSGAVSGVFDVGDRVLYRYVTTLFQPRELQFHEVRFQTPILSHGTILEVWGNYARTRPGFTLKILDIEGESYSWNIRLRHPIARSRATNLWLYGGFDWRNSTNDVLTATFSDDRLRVFRYGVLYEAVDELRGVNQLDVQVSHGMDALGARGDSREHGRVDFTKVTLDYSRNQQIWGPVSIFGQFSGQTFGRAFDPSEKTGDHGLAVAVELRYTVDTFNLPFADLPTSLQLFGFGDWGRVYHIDTNTRTNFETLASAGLGLRYSIGQNLSGQIEGAVPLFGRVAANGTEGKSWRVFFVLNARY